MPLVSCAKVTAGSGGAQYDVTLNLYPNCPAGYVVTTSTYVLGLETQLAALQQAAADAQSATLVAQANANQCFNTLSAASCTGTGATYTTDNLLLGTTVLSSQDIAIAFALSWAFGRLILFIRQFTR